MNQYHLFGAIIAATGLLLASTAVAFDDETYKILKYPSLNDEALKQVPFKAYLPENMDRVCYELHNPFRDKAVAGIVLQVTFKEASAETPTVIELFVASNCGPLESTSGQPGCFKAEARKAGAQIALKEVYYVPEKPGAAKATTHSQKKH
jgi:hypothetical protein